MKFIKPIFYSAFLLLTTFILKTASAQTPPDPNGIDFPDSKFSSIEGLIIGVGDWFFGIAAAFAALAVTYSGIMYITAGDDTDRASKAKKNLTWAIIGLIFTVGALFIVRNFNHILNSNSPG